MLKRLFGNTIWIALAIPDWLRFRIAWRNVRESQQKILNRILQANAESEVGKEFAFDELDSIESFQAAVPIRSYSEIEANITRMCAGAERVLCSERPALFQWTSGTSGGRKLIPYTDALKRDFQRAVNPWLVDLYWSYPRLFCGTSFWQISPLGSEVAGLEQSDSEASQNRIGFADDAEYLSGAAQLLWKSVSAVPSGIQRISDPELFRRVLSLHLLAAQDLRLISVWSPTFLLALFEWMQSNCDSLVHDLGHGTLNGEAVSQADLPGECSFRPSPERAREVAAHFRSEHPFRNIWPRIVLVSMWTEGFAARFVKPVRDWFPGVCIQTKGLIATEAIVSLPQVGARHARVPAITSHFLEFEDVTTKAIHLADELEFGGIYEVIVTTSGGLYRYRLGDRVRVSGSWQSQPLLEVLGRDSSVSDLFGEKLHEEHVAHCFSRALQLSNLHSELYFLVPQETASGYRYVAYLQTETVATEELESFRKNLESALSSNPHYEYCRKLGQLAEVDIELLGANAYERYVAMSRGRHISPGGEKPSVLLQFWQTHLNAAAQSR